MIFDEGIDLAGDKADGEDACGIEMADDDESDFRNL